MQRHRWIIRGGARLEGEVRVPGAKNAVLPALAATLLTPRPCTLRAVPDITDVRVMVDILQALGARVQVSNDIQGLMITVQAHDDPDHRVPADKMERVRSSSFLLGPLLARVKRATLATPGGCDLGPRPIDLHIKGLRAMGASIRAVAGGIEAEAAELEGAQIHLDYPSVGATENLMLAGVRAQGTTLIINAAREPEIVDLGILLNRMGAHVRGAGTSTVRVEGVEALTGTEHTVIPDRIVTGTLVLAGVMTRGDLLLQGVIPDHLRSLLLNLAGDGVGIDTGGDWIRVRASGRLAPVRLRTLPYPGFPTDLQAPLVAALTLADGPSQVKETIFARRFAHVEPLLRMGACIELRGDDLFIDGVDQLRGAAVEARDLRAGAALVLAGLVAQGETVILGGEHIDRGYAALDGMLSSLGAHVSVRALESA